MFTVYCHINKINGKKYVGITKQNPEIRWHGGNGYNNSEYFWRAIKKYGWRNFEHKILYKNLTKEEAIDLDVEDNWLCVCSACHAKLTPKNLLCKYGISNAKKNNEKILKRSKFLGAIDAELNDGIILRPVEIIDIFMEVYGK